MLDKFREKFKSEKRLCIFTFLNHHTNKTYKKY